MNAFASKKKTFLEQKVLAQRNEGEKETHDVSEAENRGVKGSKLYCRKIRSYHSL
jgi:hypothetical protein